MTETYDISVIAAIIHIIMRTTSFTAYASGKNTLLRNVRQTAKKLVLTDNVLIIRFAVLNAFRIK